MQMAADLYPQCGFDAPFGTMAIVGLLGDDTVVRRLEPKSSGISALEARCSAYSNNSSSTYFKVYGVNEFLKIIECSISARVPLRVIAPF
jgi:hypothetical protein